MIVTSWKLKEYLTFKEVCLLSFFERCLLDFLVSRSFRWVKLSAASTSIDLFIFL